MEDEIAFGPDEEEIAEEYLPEVPGEEDWVEGNAAVEMLAARLDALDDGVRDLAERMARDGERTSDDWRTDRFYGLGRDEFFRRHDMLRKPFDKSEIEKLPRYTGRKENGRIPKEAYGLCMECGKRHPLPAIHLDYVGHAGITDRLNEVDPWWNWKPLRVYDNGSPILDNNGGMWIALTVLGITRLGYGDAQGKSGPNAIKELIGDAIRNAAMRFGVATYLWSKSERADQMREYVDPERADETKPQQPKEPPESGPFVAHCDSCGTAFTFDSRDQYLGYVSQPTCCANPCWVVD